MIIASAFVGARRGYFGVRINYQKIKKTLLTLWGLLYTIRRILIRSIAQPGSAPVLGTGGRGFKSLYSDHFKISMRFNYAPIAQLDSASPF